MRNPAHERAQKRPGASDTNTHTHKALVSLPPSLPSHVQLVRSALSQFQSVHLVRGAAGQPDSQTNVKQSMHAVLLSVHPSLSLDPNSDLELLGRDLLGLLGSGRLGLDGLDLGLLVLGADLDGGLGLGPGTGVSEGSQGEDMKG